MSKQFWNRNQRSVSLPRSELVEINPMMPGRSGAAEGAAGLSSSGPQMTVETLFPSSSSPGNGQTKPDGKPNLDRIMKESSSKNLAEIAGTPLSPKENSDGTLRRTSDKENMHHRQGPTGSRHLAATASRLPSKMDELGDDWRKSSQVAVSARENRSSFQLTSTVASTSYIVISSDDDDYPDSKLGDWETGKKIHTLAGETAKKRAEDQKSGEVAHPASQGTKTKATSQLTDPKRRKVGSWDFVYHQNLSDKIAVTTVMPKFCSLWDSSLSPDSQPSTSNNNPTRNATSLQSGWNAPPTNDADFCFVEDLDNRRVVEELMPELLTPPRTAQPLEKNSPTRDLFSLLGDDDNFPLSICTDESSNRDPLWGSTCIRWEERKGKERHWDSAWKNDLCESAIRDIPVPAAPPSSVDSWRAVETICMRMRGVDVPDNLGFPEEPPSFDDLLDVLGVWEQEDKADPKN